MNKKFFIKNKENLRVTPQGGPPKRGGPKQVPRSHPLKHTTVHGTYLSVPFPSHSSLCLSHPMGRFPWDSHRNDITMDKPGNRPSLNLPAGSAPVTGQIQGGIGRSPFKICESNFIHHNF